VGTDLALPEKRVLTSNGTIPPIVRHLHRFQPDEKVLAREFARYSTLEGKLSAEEKGVLNVHGALEQGRVLIDLATCLRQQNGAMFPTLAAARLTDTKVFCRVRPDSRVQLRSHHRGRVFFEFEGIGAPSRGWVERCASVPTLPPELKRRVNVHDENLLVVWEANWTRERRQMQLNLDPALLEHVAGSLYAVEAIWDLSPIEAGILNPKVR
jgi:hypothetical protein